MIDIHCHLLPGIDDGPSDMETSLRMARIAADDGITHIVATPHFSYGEGPSKEDIGRCLEVFTGRALGEDIPVKLLSGADVKLTAGLIGGIERNDIPTINGSRYFLIELPDIHLPNLDGLLLRAKLKGYAPVVTHPERNYGFLSGPEKLGPLRKAGALFQITAMSITGGFGSQVAGFSRMLCRKGFVDFVASDAHDAEYRRPVLSEAFREISRLVGDRYAGKIFFENPESLLKNAEVRMS